MTERTEGPIDETDATADPRLQAEAQAAGAAIEEDATGDLETALQQAREEASSNYDKFLRARADLENYRKRTERDMAALRRSAKRELLTKLLTVKDNLERALHYGENGSSNAESIMEGVRLTQYQLDSLLEGENVRAIQAEGTEFDPHLAEAVHRVNDPSVPDHTIVQVVRNGYTYGDDVLRPAQVVVSVHGDDS